MTVSIFTPTHRSDFLPKIYESLRLQTDSDWEWIILLNGQAVPVEFDDARVKIFRAWNAKPWVGLLKSTACKYATGDILLELDHDDLLMPEAIAEVKKAFEDPSIGFAYSNTIHAHVASDGKLEKLERFSEAYGWRFREIDVDGVILDEHIHFEPTPSCVSRIWFAPNHLRAFRRSTYEEIGGYNEEMRILDDLDLMCRLYKVSRFHHIDKGLYVYRVHGENTWLVPDINAEIQNNVYRIHDQYIEDLTEVWARRENLRCIELGGRMAARKDFETVDLKDANIIADLNERWPFEDGTVGVIRAYDVFEHLRDPIHAMTELYRVLAPGGYAIIQVPSTDGRGAFQDPTHRSFWNENSFHYYISKEKNKYIDCPVRFQALRLYTTEKDAQQVCWTRAHLMKLIDGMRVPGEILI